MAFYLENIWFLYFTLSLTFFSISFFFFFNCNYTLFIVVITKFCSYTSYLTIIYIFCSWFSYLSVIFFRVLITFTKCIIDKTYVSWIFHFVIIDICKFFFNDAKNFLRWKNWYSTNKKNRCDAIFSMNFFLIREKFVLV